MFSRLTVLRHGSPKVALLAATLHDAFPRQALDTTDIELAALQLPVA